MYNVIIDSWNKFLRIIYVQVLSYPFYNFKHSLYSHLNNTDILIIYSRLLLKFDFEYPIWSSGPRKSARYRVHCFVTVTDGQWSDDDGSGCSDCVDDDAALQLVFDLSPTLQSCWWRRASCMHVVSKCHAVGACVVWSINDAVWCVFMMHDVACVMHDASCTMMHAWRCMGTTYIYFLTVVRIRINWTLIYQVSTRGLQWFVVLEFTDLWNLSTNKQTDKYK